MINEIFALWAPGPLESIVIFAVFFITFVIPTALIVLFVIYLIQKNKERQDLRAKVQELAEEVSKLKQERQ